MSRSKKLSCIKIIIIIIIIIIFITYYCYYYHYYPHSILNIIHIERDTYHGATSNLALQLLITIVHIVNSFCFALKLVRIFPILSLLPSIVSQSNSNFLLERFRLWESQSCYKMHGEDDSKSREDNFNAFSYDN